MAGIIRITMFKIPLKENQEKMLPLYATLSTTNSKNGAPYILSLAAGHAYEDQRSQGYTIVAKTEFKNKEDMDYYDTECEAHKNLKAEAKNLGVEGVMTVYYTPAVVATL